MRGEAEEEEEEGADELAGRGHEVVFQGAAGGRGGWAARRVARVGVVVVVVRAVAVGAVGVQGEGLFGHFGGWRLAVGGWWLVVGIGGREDERIGDAGMAVCGCGCGSMAGRWMDRLTGGYRQVGRWIGKGIGK